MLDRVENTQGRVRAVPGHDDDLDTFLPAGQFIQIKQCLDQRESRPRVQYLTLMLNLIPAVCFHTLCLKYRIFIGQVEERPGRDAHYQFIVKIIRHKLPPVRIQSVYGCPYRHGSGPLPAGIWILRWFTLCRHDAERDNLTQSVTLILFKS